MTEQEAQYEIYNLVISILSDMYINSPKEFYVKASQTDTRLFLRPRSKR